MFSRLCGNATKRMFHNQPDQNSSCPLCKASEYFGRRRPRLIALATIYVSVAYNQSHINKWERIMERTDKHLERMYENVEGIDRLRKEIKTELKKPGN